eukprot:scaffold341094_cov45-Prasinocladus_malaysianus.AAC.1
MAKSRSYLSVEFCKPCLAVKFNSDEGASSPAADVDAEGPASDAMSSGESRLSCSKKSLAMHRIACTLIAGCALLACRF